jgi:hypothetical protein
MERGSGHALGSITLKGYVEGLNGDRQSVLVKVKNRDGRVCRLARVVLVGAQ